MKMCNKWFGKGEEKGAHKTLQHLHELNCLNLSLVLRLLKMLFDSFECRLNFKIKFCTATRVANGLEFLVHSYDRDQPFTFQLGAGQVIRGWDEGLTNMCVGK